MRLHKPSRTECGVARIQNVKVLALSADPVLLACRLQTVGTSVMHTVDSEGRYDGLTLREPCRRSWTRLWLRAIRWG